MLLKGFESFFYMYIKFIKIFLFISNVCFVYLLEKFKIVTNIY